MKKIIFISLAVIIACGLLSFVGTSNNGNSNGPSITFKKDKHHHPISKMVYEDMQGMDYRDSKKVVIRNIERYKATTAYQGKNYVTTNTNSQSIVPQIALTNNTASYGMSNGGRTGSSSGLMAQNVSYNSHSSVKTRNRGVAIASNGTTVMTGAVYGAAADHDHSVGGVTEEGATCGQDGCDAHGEWVFNEATGVWGIEWKAPIGDAILPLLLCLLLYIGFRRKV